MSVLRQFVDLFLHLDKYLQEIIQQFGAGTYVILFLVVFCETGLVVTPFLPGDSLLFAVGAFAAVDSLHLGWVLLTLMAAAILGDTMNYWIGRRIGPKAFELANGRFLKREHLEKTRAFYEKHGGKAIILARFMPIIRTFAPFVAGVGAMNYRRFFVYNVAGGVVWVGLFVLGGYLFGNVPSVKRNFSYVILAIIVISLSPIAREWWRHRKKASTAPADNMRGV